jgi:hypothetical protein
MKLRENWHMRKENGNECGSLIVKPDGQRDHWGDKADNWRQIELCISNVVFENVTGMLWLECRFKRFDFVAENINLLC